MDTWTSLEPGGGHTQRRGSSQAALSGDHSGGLGDAPERPALAHPWVRRTLPDRLPRGPRLVSRP